jgi:LuxR family maltose regulon positive regulatory protein
VDWVAAYLVESSILARFCAPLSLELHRVADTDAGTDDVRKFKAWLAEADFFIIPLDEHRHWFRFHHLFQEFLRHVLGTERGPDTVKALHLAASRWYAGERLIEEAIRHALAGDAVDTAADLVLEHRHRLLNDAQYHRLNGWLALLPEEAFAMQPQLLTTRALIALNNGQVSDVVAYPDHARRMLGRLEPGSESHAALRGEVAVFRGLLAVFGGIDPETRAELEQTADALPAEARSLGVLRAAVDAVFHQMDGEPARSEALLQDWGDHPGLPIGVRSRAWFYRCVLSFLEMDLSGVLRTGCEALRLAAQAGIAHTTGGTSYFIGVAHYLRNELDAARSHLQRVIEEQAKTDAVYVTQARGVLSFISAAAGDPDQVPRILAVDEGAGWYGRNESSAAVMAALRVEVALRTGNRQEADRLATNLDFESLPLAWPHYVPQLTRIRLLLAAGTRAELQKIG